MKKPLLTVCLMIGLALPAAANTPLVEYEPDVVVSTEQAQQASNATIAVQETQQEHTVESLNNADMPAKRRGTSTAAYGFVIGTVGGYIAGAIVFGTLGHAIALGMLGGLTGTFVGTIVDKVI
jgi:hypothetical protein